MARNFTGTDRLSTANVPIAASLTWAFWYRQTDASAGGKFPINHNASRIIIDGGATPSILFDRDYATTDARWTLTYANAGSPTLSEWNHFAWVHSDGSPAKAYVNGVERTVTSTTAAAGAIDTTSRTLVVGNNGAFNSAVDGDLAWVAMYPIALSGAQIVEVMEQGSITGADGAWEINGSSPEPDSSGNGRNLTVTGTTVTDGPAGVPPTGRPSRLLLLGIG